MEEGRDGQHATVRVAARQPARRLARRRGEPGRPLSEGHGHRRRRWHRREVDRGVARGRKAGAGALRKQARGVALGSSSSSLAPCGRPTCRWHPPAVAVSPAVELGGTLPTQAKRSVERPGRRLHQADKAGDEEDQAREGRGAVRGVLWSGAASLRGVRVLDPLGSELHRSRNGNSVEFSFRLRSLEPGRGR